MKNKVSVIVPIYNVEKYLKRCIESIQKQTYSNLEILLIDDGSPDDCGIICDDYAKADTRIKVIHQNNKGLAETRNIGIENATGEYIVFIDSDDYIDYRMIEILYRNLIKYDADMSSCGHYQIYDSGRVEKNSNTNKISVLNTEQALKKFMYTHVVDVVSWNKLFKKKLFNDIKYPCNKLYEDHYTTYKLINNSKIIVYDPQPLYYYCKRSDSIGGSKFSERTYELSDALEIECNFITMKYPQIKNDIQLAKILWLMVVYNKMMIANVINLDYVNYLNKEIKGNLINCIKSKEISKTKKLQIILFYYSKKLYKNAYSIFIKKYR